MSKQGEKFLPHLDVRVRGDAGRAAQQRRASWAPPSTLADALRRRRAGRRPGGPGRGRGVLDRRPDRGPRRAGSRRTRRATPAGIWVDELAGLDLDATVLRTLGRRRASSRARSTSSVGRTRCSTATALAARAAASTRAAPTVVRGRVVGANHDRWQSTVVLHDARLRRRRRGRRRLRAVAGAGAPQRRGRRAATERPRSTTRTTVGVVARCSTPPGPAGACVLMDWSAPAGGATASRRGRRPSTSVTAGGSLRGDGADVGARPRRARRIACANGWPRGVAARRGGRPGDRRAARAADPERAPADGRLRCGRGRWSIR